MDVRCSKCGTEYEFDDSKVTPHGIAVQCTTCGHVFKVRREEGALPDPVVVGEAQVDHWIVRDREGSEHRFRELTTLQKWIVEQKVGRDDEISKTGRSWKALGEISELSSFFAVVDAANRARAAKGQSATSVAKTGSFEKPMFPAQLEYGEASANEESAKRDAQPQVHEGAAKGISSLPQEIAARRSDFEAHEPTERVDRSRRDDEDDFFSEDFGKDIDLSVLERDDPVLQWKRRSRNRKIFALLLTALLVSPLILFFASRATFDRVFAPLIALFDASASGDKDKRVEEKNEIKGGDSSPREQKEEANKAAPVEASAANKNEEKAISTSLSAKLSLNEVLAKVDVNDALNKDQFSLISRARSQQANVLNETLRLAGDDTMAAAEAKVQRDEALQEAYLMANNARSSGDKAGAHLAFGAYYAAKLSPLEMKTELNAALALEPLAKDEVARIRFQKNLLDALAKGTLDKEREALKKELSALGGEKDERLFYGQAMLYTSKEAAHLEGMKGLTGAKRPTPLGLNALKAQEAQKPKAPSLDDMKFADLLRRGQAHQRAGRVKPAISHLRAAIKKSPASNPAWMALGWAYLDAGKSNKALDAFENVVERAPRLPDAQLGMAEALRYTGRKSAAIAAYKRYLELSPNGREANMAKNAIKTLSQ